MHLNVTQLHPLDKFRRVRHPGEQVNITFTRRGLFFHIAEVLSEEPCEPERRDDGNWCVYSVYRELAVGAAASSRPNEAHSSFSAG